MIEMIDNDKAVNIDASPARVAGLLKRTVNDACEGDWEWFPDVAEEHVSLFDMLRAIEILEANDGTGIAVASSPKEASV